MKIVTTLVLVMAAMVIYAQDVEYIDNGDGTFKEVITTIEDSLTSEEVEARCRERFECLLRENNGYIRSEVETERVELEVPEIVYDDEGRAVRIIRYRTDTTSIEDVLYLEDYVDNNSEVDAALERLERAEASLVAAQENLIKNRAKRTQQIIDLRQEWEDKYKAIYNSKYQPN